MAIMRQSVPWERALKRSSCEFFAWLYNYVWVYWNA